MFAYRRPVNTSLTLLPGPEGPWSAPLFSIVRMQMNEKAQELSAVLRELQQGILKVASDVAGTREGMTQLQLGNFIGNDRDRNGVY